MTNAFIKKLPAASSNNTPYLDRDDSLLAFNHRVLDWARRSDVPLLERLRYLCIVSSNLDELFEVRIAPHLLAYKSGDTKGSVSVDSFEALYTSGHTLVMEQYALFNGELTAEFERNGISIIAHGERNTEQRKWVKKFFEDEVRPLLMPVSLDPAHPFPQVASKSLNFIVELGGKDAFDRANAIAIVKVPRVLPRLIALPAKLCGKQRLFISLSSVIRAHLQDLFPGREMGQFSQFRITRHSDMAIDEDDVKNLRMALRQGLQQRHYGMATRIEVSSNCSQKLYELLLQQFELPLNALYRVPGPVNLVRFGQLIDLINEPKLCFAPYVPSYPASMQTSVRGLSVFDRLKHVDALVHLPYESFDAVVDFLREAVYDPKVLAIRQTVYRTGSDSVMMELLCEAVRRGKEVLAVVELKARFDEEANINWAERLESIGAQVVYGVVGLKTHAKMLLLTRKEGKQLRRYGHLSTGNYNPRTARLYTDLSHFTSDEALTSDMEQLFIHLASQSHVPRLKKMWMAPFHLQQQWIAQIEHLKTAALKGKATRLIAKMNSLTDEPIMDALVSAAQAGVQIDLIVRGACMLPAQLAGYTDNIRIRSVIGRFLEHTRVFYFRNGEDEQLYLSSADWMNRNMLRRIELAWPITNPALRQRIVEECLSAYLYDGVDAWQMQPDGQYQPTHHIPGGHSAQQALMARYRQTS
jgi:polyphosphate kinase